MIIPFNMSLVLFGCTSMYSPGWDRGDCIVSTTGTAHDSQPIVSMPRICVQFKVTCLGRKKWRVMEIMYAKYPYTLKCEFMLAAVYYHYRDSGARTERTFTFSLELGWRGGPPRPLPSTSDSDDPKICPAESSGQWYKSSSPMLLFYV